MLSIFRRLMKNAEGATAIEYTLIASLIAVAAIATSPRSASGHGSRLGPIIAMMTTRASDAVAAVCPLGNDND